MLRQRTWRIAAGVLALLLLPGWGGAAAQVESVLMGTTIGGAAGFITNIIKQHNLDAKNGLNLDLKAFSPDKLQNVLIARQIEVGLINPIALVRVNLRGNKMRLFGPLLWNHTSLVVQPDSKVAAFADLKGKKVAILPRVSGGFNTWALANRMRGLDPEKPYQMIFGPPPVILGLFHKKEVEVVASFEPYTTALLADKAGREITTISELWRESTGEPMLLIGLGAYQEWLDTHQRQAKKTVATLGDAVATFFANPRRAIEANLDYFKAKTKAHADLLEQRLPKIYTNRWDGEIVANLRLIVQKSVEFGILERAPEGEQFLQLK
ncbi:MAG: ABC transporter substrate-binding protein [Candidatus Tectomicrobia bacterium]|nr:ABC transporter substrate-binding protein [Candidatus Tectomicrobia bacterium]